MSNYRTFIELGRELGVSSMWHSLAPVVQPVDDLSVLQTMKAYWASVTLTEAET